MTTPPPWFEAGAEIGRLTTIGTGGAARFLARPSTRAELREALAWAAGEDLPTAVVGFGSNLLVADGGYAGVAIHLEGELASIEIAGSEVRAGGGASLAAVVRRSTDAGLAGIEFGCAIPGSVGGAVRMNAGAYGREMADVLGSAEMICAGGTRSGGPGELDLAYRHSNVRPGEVVAHAVLWLTPDEPAKVRARVREMQRQRSESQPRKARTFGSVFKNPPEGRGAGALIEACGLKGHVVGGARISLVHANFIESDGTARSADVAALVSLARSSVRERFGVELEHEVELLGPIRLD